MPLPIIHETFGQRDTTTTAFSTLLGVLVIILMLVFLLSRIGQYLTIGPYGV
jgi:flagellar biogenesis protein FliO